MVHEDLNKLLEHCCCSAFTPHDTDYNCLSPDCVSVIANNALGYIAELEAKIRELEFNMEELQSMLTIPPDWPELMARKCYAYEQALKEARRHLLYDGNHPTRMHAIRIIDNALAAMDEALDG